MKPFSVKRLTLISVLAALSLLAFLIESLIPMPFIPGARLGLGNVFVALSLVWLTLPETLLLLFAKCVLSSFFGGAISLIYSVVGGLASVLVEYFLLRFCETRLSHVSISVVAACVHNVSQLLIFAVITSTAEVFLYLPYYLVLGAIAGAAVGLLVTVVLSFVDFPVRFIAGETKDESLPAKNSVAATASKVDATAVNPEEVAVSAEENSPRGEEIQY